MRTMRALGRWGLLSTLVVIPFLRGASARASCAESAPKIVWSYPADGDIDIPTNAHIFVLTSLGATTPDQQILVNGQPAAEAADGTFGLAPAMQPNTAYVVTVPLAPSSGSTGALTFGFTTGVGATDGPIQLSPFTVDRVVTSKGAPSLSPMCQDVVAAMDCFDTGQDTTVTFETQMRPAVFFVVPGDGASIPWTMTWPGTCGSPEIFTRGCTGMYRIFAVNFEGMAQTADVSCASATVGSAGCSVAPGGGGTSRGELAVGVLLGLGLALPAAFRGYARRGRSALG